MIDSGMVWHCIWQVIFAFEEAIGFMLGPMYRDKDGVSTAAVFAELAADLYSKGSSVSLTKTCVRSPSEHMEINHIILSGPFPSIYQLHPLYRLVRSPCNRLLKGCRSYTNSTDTLFTVPRTLSLINRRRAGLFLSG